MRYTALIVIFITIIFFALTSKRFYSYYYLRSDDFTKSLSELNHDYLSQLTEEENFESNSEEIKTFLKNIGSSVDVESNLLLINGIGREDWNQTQFLYIYGHNNHKDIKKIVLPNSENVRYPKESFFGILFNNYDLVIAIKPIYPDEIFIETEN